MIPLNRFQYHLIKLPISRVFVWHWMFYCIGWTFEVILSSPEKRFQVQPQIKFVNQRLLTEPKSSQQFPLIEAHLWHMIEPIRLKKIFMNPKPGVRTPPRNFKRWMGLGPSMGPSFFHRVKNIFILESIKYLQTNCRIGCNSNYFSNF